ncbi:MAG: riboflavin synthase [Eubacterium sp.]|nr:riboflavin synthase [Eubacterium sp.]
MFTGIIEEKGTIESVRKGGGSYKLKIACSKVLGLEDMRPTAVGDSIAVNGICLTVTELTDSSFTADVMPETVSRTSLKDAHTGAKVDLERAMPAYGRFGGHIVSGHIDGTGEITGIRKDGNAVWYDIKTSSEIAELIVEKGSIAIDGISLTVAKTEGLEFSCSIIPHTVEETILPCKKVGSTVNLETDVVGKYVRKLAEEGRISAAAGPDTRKPGADRSLLELL